MIFHYQKHTVLNYSVLSATAKASLNSLDPAAGLGGAGGGTERAMPEAGLLAEGMITFSMRASSTEKRDRLSAAIVLLVSEMSGADIASFTSLTLELASTIRLRTPAMSKNKGGGVRRAGGSPW